VAQNKATSDDNIVSVLDFVDENLSEVKSSDSNIGDNHELDDKSGASDSEQSDGHVIPVVSGGMM
jgi:hypothetical protein